MKNPTQLSLSFLLFFSLSLLLSCNPVTAQNNTLHNRTVFDIGVVLDLGSPLGKMTESCISMALADFYTIHNYTTTKLLLHWRDSNQDIIDAASMALELLKNVQVKAIIGPETSAQAQFVAELGDKAHVPILSFSATSPLLSPILTPYFIRTALNDSSQVKAIAAIIQAFEWREVVSIYQDTTDYGSGFIPHLTDALQEVDARVAYKCVISHLATDDEITQELFKLETIQSSRVFVVHLSPSLSSRLFFKARKLEMMSEGYVWIITDGLTNLLDSMNSSVIESMQGVLGVKPYVPKSKELDNFVERWKTKYRAELSISGLWAYDTVWALAKAVEGVGTGNSNLLKPQTRQYYSTDLARLGVSEMGQRFRDSILKTNFKGLSGDFNLTDGHLSSSGFQIVNVIGKGERVIGFWTPIHGLDKKLNSGKKIIWPGESTSVPKGWVIATNGKKLRIGVPKKTRFTEFVNVMQNPQTNEWIVIGYSIDVFNAALTKLPYAVDYEFVPFQDKYGKRNGTYNDLIYQVYLKNFDAVVADTTIMYNRSQYVDFTLPYTESGVTMLVMAKDNRKKALSFLKPLSWDLWLMTGAAFVFTGIVVWALEHRINDEFRGPLAHQVGLILWFSFSTLVFAHRERVVSNLSRFVMIIWLFVVLILTSSYTASLTSLLTVQQLQPAINSIDDLIKNRENVGTFVVDILRKLKVEESKLKAYATSEEFAEALSKGTQKGGVGAVMDEIPYLRLFLAKDENCAKYKMVGPIYKTDGFGFVFPKGSPLVPDMSRAILNVTQGNEMTEIEKKWIGAQTTCPDQPRTAPSNSLTLDSFWGLFLITGTASISAFLIFLFSFLYNHRHDLITCDSSVSFQQRLITIIRRFNERDLSHHTFRRARPNESMEMGTRHAETSAPVDASVEPSNPNPNRRAAVVITEVEDDGRYFQLFHYELPARSRWRLLYRAWRSNPDMPASMKITEVAQVNAEIN